MFRRSEKKNRLFVAKCRLKTERRRKENNRIGGFFFFFFFTYYRSRYELLFTAYLEPHEVEQICPRNKTAMLNDMQTKRICLSAQ